MGGKKNIEQLLKYYVIGGVSLKLKGNFYGTKFWTFIKDYSRNMEITKMRNL